MAALDMDRLPTGQHQWRMLVEGLLAVGDDRSSLVTFPRCRLHHSIRVEWSRNMSQRRSKTSRDSYTVTPASAYAVPAAVVAGQLDGRGVAAPTSAWHRSWLSRSARKAMGTARRCDRTSMITLDSTPHR
jgi:hypothetical protein